MKKVQSIINSVYFDPNSDGIIGYSNISSLLLFYDEVILYGPVSSFIEGCNNNPELNKTSLTPDEFVSYILKGRIIPLGFNSFWNEAKRQDQPNPNLRMTSDFDIELIKNTSVIGKKVYRIEDTFKLDYSPLLVKSVLNKNQILYNKILAQAENISNLPRRYVDYLEKKTKLPEHLQKAISIKNDYEALPYLVLYDFFNNKYVMREQGNALLHVEDNLAKNLYSSIHGFDDQIIAINDKDIKLLRSEISDLIKEAVSLCISKVTYGRLTSEDIDFFYENLKDGFIQAIWESIHTVSNINDRDKRKEKFLSSLDHKLRKIKLHSNIGIEFLVDAALSKLNLPEISQYFMSIFYGDDDSVRRKLHHIMHRPILKKHRWAYHFIKEER